MFLLIFHIFLNISDYLQYIISQEFYFFCFQNIKFGYQDKHFDIFIIIFSILFLGI